MKIKTLFICVLLFTICNASVTQSIETRIDSIEHQVSYSGYCLQKYHVERKWGLIGGGTFATGGMLWALNEDKPFFKKTGYGFVAAGILFFIVSHIHSERWLKRVSIRLTGSGIQYTF